MKAPPVIYFKWTSDIELGHVEIDAQHQRLFLLGEAATQSLSDATQHAPAQLHAFIRLAQEHFAYEEDLMRSSAYPDIERHAKYHASLLAELIVHSGKLQSGEVADSASLNSFLWNWLILHIDIADRELVAWLKSSGDLPERPDPGNEPASGSRSTSAAMGSRS